MSIMRSFGLLVLASPLLTSCGDPSELSSGYEIPECAATEYYDGTLGTCTTRVTSLEFPAAFLDSDGDELAFRDGAYDARATNLQSFITGYVGKHLTDLTLSTAASCTAAVEANTSYSDGYYDGWQSVNCGFALSDSSGAILTLTYDESTAGSVYLKALQNPTDGKVSLKLCTVGEVTTTSYAVSGTTLTIDEEAKVTTTSSCSDFGTDYSINSALPQTNAALQAMPQTVFKYLSNEQETAVVSTGTSILDFSIARLADVTTLPINCDGTSFDITVTLTPDLLTPVTGNAVITAFDTTNFFAETSLTTAGGDEYTQGRSIFGCSKTTCLDDDAEKKIPYLFFGSTLILQDSFTWNISTGPTSLSYATQSVANTDSVCAPVYTEQ